MSTIKKRQHYVWRHYLRSWADNENIWTFFKQLNKIEHPSLMGVAQEKYFYKLIDLTPNEEDFIRKFVDKISPPDLKGLNQDFVNTFTIPSKFRQLLKENKNPNINRELAEEYIRKIDINLMEDAHSLMESRGFQLLACKSIEDIKALDNNNDEIFEAIMFLCFQYFRTKNLKATVSKSFNGGNNEALINNSWGIISFPMATILAKSIALDKNLKFNFIENDSKIHFITGDQPVFNILNDKVNAKGEVVELELYYPLTPQSALIIHFKTDQIEKFEKKLADDEMINYYNKKVFENSGYYVFADNKEQLESLLKNKS